MPLITPTSASVAARATPTVVPVLTTEMVYDRPLLLMTPATWVE